MTRELKMDLLKMTKLKNKDIKFDKNRIARLVEINRLIRIVDKSLKENVGGFLTYYTQKIKELSTIPSIAETREEIKLSEEEKVLTIIRDREQKMFWDSLEYFMKTDIDFKIKAQEIISRLIVNNNSPNVQDTKEEEDAE